MFNKFCMSYSPLCMISLLFYEIKQMPDQMFHKISLALVTAQLNSV